MAEWAGKNVLIIGAARQGLALARYLVSHGASVILNDLQPESQLRTVIDSLADLPAERFSCVFGGHPLDVLYGVDLVCPSGGVPLSLPLIQEAQARGIPLSNDSQIFLEAAPCLVIGITGSAGKTTTTALVGRMAQAAVEGRPEQAAARSGQDFSPHRAWVGGNIGNPLLAVVDEMAPKDVAVMELSSFQLELMTCSPEVAAVLNITPNHLDRHASMEAYTAAKARILAFQTSDDAAVLGRDDPGAWSLSGQVTGQLYSFGLSDLPAGQDGTFLRGETLFWRDSSGEKTIMPRSAVGLRGDHNLLNVLAACAAAGAAGFSSEAMQAGVEGFQGVPHRLEFVRNIGGVQWYNDSIATAPERTLAAIRSFEEPLVLLAGGRDKNLPWESFAQQVLERVDHLVLFGEAAGKIEQALQPARRAKPNSALTVSVRGGLEEAVHEAAHLAQPGDVVLLSPGGTSFDEFRDFEDRGEAYRRWVMDL